MSQHNNLEQLVSISDAGAAYLVATSDGNEPNQVSSGMRLLLTANLDRNRWTVDHQSCQDRATALGECLRIVASGRPLLQATRLRRPSLPPGVINR